MSNASDRTPLLRANGATAGTENPVHHSRTGLRRVSDSLPRSVWLIATIEFGERFSALESLA